jgi:DSF synthase
MTYIGTRFTPALAADDAATHPLAREAAGRSTPAHGLRPPLLPERGYDTLDVDIDEARGLFWCRLRPQGRPCFSPGLLRDIETMHRSIRMAFRPEDRRPAAARPPLRWFACASAVPGIFNLGGDLGLFRSLIAEGDIDGLRRYGRACVQAIHRSHTAMDLPMITLSLVQGDALGGGFECALAHDVIVAERSAKFGLPEVLFNLFPGMGAYSLLSRRIGRIAAERLILGGKVHTAEELHEIGLVDVLAPDGEGTEALLGFVDGAERWHNARLATYRARRRVDPVTLEELLDVVEVWAEAAARLGEPDLRRMARLAAAQDRRVAAPAPARAPEPALA